MYLIYIVMFISVSHQDGDMYIERFERRQEKERGQGKWRGREERERMVFVVVEGGRGRI